MTVHWFGLSESLLIQDEVRSVLHPLSYPIHWHIHPKDLREALKGVERAVILLHPGKVYDLYEICRELSLTFSHPSIILLVPEQDLDLKKAMRMGATDAIALPLRKEELKQAAEEAESRHRLQGTPEKEGRVITVCGAKGGVGKTTLSVNLAVAFSKYELKVAVLDADLQFGDIAIMFDTQPKRTMYELVLEPEGDLSALLDRYMIHHSSGVDILAAPHRPEFSEVITGEHMTAIIKSLKNKYDIVIIDTPPSLMETGLVALENAADILLITSMELPTLKNSKLCMETLQSLGLKDRIKVILNRDSEIEGLRLKSVEQVLGSEVFCRIPSEGKVVVPSVNTGIPFVLTHSRTPVARSIFSLASRLQGTRNPGREGKGKASLLTKWLGRG